ncbi:hypothetical protein C8E00_10559 [Chromohalobacter marismortui]|uniref:DUF192 domain-containing protein n=1 Tax=Chromohalobacter marismortui TaxID=42055 RepID=A0A4R7NLC6_9GAMM|nr:MULTISPECIES: DUF192 domain-containing protein [Chromohalobacter]MCI0510158.1 DUF192 domain-containing protein [Chromohalobacter sp.]MCI0592486.1 DUF192 domain-containing protein [Chromohalobacter sp.]TDU21575.1 hypothetical protein C8E00_10559 [Chromohalobacter marismortui]
MKRVLYVSGWGALGMLVLTLAFAAPRSRLERATLEVAGETLSVEVARQADDRARGLMERDALASDAGMLFVYPRQQPPEAVFWMYRTRIPLDIAFLGADGEVRAIRHMQPCQAVSSAACRSYSAGAPFRAALEVNTGYFARHGIEVGDRLPIAPLLSPR